MSSEDQLKSDKIAEGKNEMVLDNDPSVDNIASNPVTLSDDESENFIFPDYDPSVDDSAINSGTSSIFHNIFVHVAIITKTRFIVFRIIEKSLIYYFLIYIYQKFTENL